MLNSNQSVVFGLVFSCCRR